jgi:hypothetical protein
MGNNRRNQSGAIRFVPALKAVVLCSLLGGSCVGYVLQKNKIHELGQQIGARQVRLDRLKRENQLLSDRLAGMQMPQRLGKQAADMKLGLVQPARHQIVWISEPVQSLQPVAPFTNAGPLHYVQLNRKP